MRIVFLCRENSARSQIAEALTREMAKKLGKKVEVYSAGTEPAGYVHALAKRVLEEEGISTKGLYSKGIGTVPVRDAELIITLCDSARRSCPWLPGTKHVHWPIPDPAGRGIFAFRWVRDEIRKRVKELLSTL